MGFAECRKYPSPPTLVISFRLFIALLHEQDVGDDIRACIGFEGGFGQAYRG